MAGLDMYAERGQWERCIEIAAKQVRKNNTQEDSGTMYRWEDSGSVYGGVDPGAVYGWGDAGAMPHCWC